MPFRSVQLKFRIQSSIADALHIVYAKPAEVNEYSGRYSVMIDTSFVPSVDYLFQRIVLGKNRENAADAAKKAHALIKENRELNFAEYMMMVGKDFDLARELARAPLELNNDTTYIWKIDLQNLVEFIKNKRALLKDTGPSTLCAYLDLFEQAAFAVAPEATSALLSNSDPTRLLSLTQPKDRDVIDPTPLPASWGPSETKRCTVPALEEILFVKQPYLDHGGVQCVDYMGDNRSPVESARISYGAGTVRLQEDEKLIKYLRRHAHTTPFEANELAVEGKTPVFVDPRQAGRHRTLDDECFMGKVLLGDDYFIPQPGEMKHQDRKNRQGRGNELDDELKSSVMESFERRYKNQLKNAKILEDLGLDQETIRNTKGVGFYTYRWRTGDLHNWLHFLGLRWDSHAQKEIFQYAEIIADFIGRQAPTCLQALEDYKRKAVTFTRTDIPLIAALVRNTINLGLLKIDDIEIYRALGYTMLVGDDKTGKVEKRNREGDELFDKLAKIISRDDGKKELLTEALMKLMREKNLIRAMI